MHDPRSRAHLVDIWLKQPFRFVLAPPIDEVRDYFGEQMAYYFAFLAHLTNALIWPALVGGVVLCAYFVYGTMDNPYSPLYSIFLLLWTTWLCKSWRREEARLAFKWNVEDFEETEFERFEFEGPLARGFYNRDGHFVDVDEGEDHAASVPLARKFTTAERRQRTLLSYGLIVPMILCVVIGTFFVLAFRSFMQVTFYYAEEIDLLDIELETDSLPWWHDYSPSIGSGMGGGLNAAFIVVMNKLYSYLAVALNNWENHRTKTGTRMLSS